MGEKGRKKGCEIHEFMHIFARSSHTKRCFLTKYEDGKVLLGDDIRK